MVKENFEKQFNELLDYIEEFERPVLTDYLTMHLRAMLRLFPKEEIKAAIDIARSRGRFDNWAKYIWGILWTRKREKKNA